MSTTSTSAEEPQPRRRRLTRYLPFTGRTAQPGTGARPGAAPGVRSSRVPLVVDDRGELGLLRDAERRGRQAARRGTLDPWVLNSGDRVPYFAELASVRDAVVHRIEEELRLQEETARLRDAQATSDVTAGEAETRILVEHLREAQQEIETARRQLDLLAVRSARWLRFRDSLRERVEERWLLARFPEAAAPPVSGSPGAAEPGLQEGEPGQAADKDAADPGGDDWQSVSTTGAAADGTASAAMREVVRAARAETRDAASSYGWEGLQTRPGLPRWMTWALLLVIMAVEVPIYWVAYQPFHGVGSVSGDTMSGALAISSAVIMLIVPHLAGLMLRWRSGTGSPRGGWVPALSLLGVWGGLTGLLGLLRAKFVTQHDSPAPASGGTDGFRGIGGASGDTTTLVDRLHLTTQTVTWLFCALLLLSGGVGFLLGLFREHPFLDAFRTAVERRTGLLRRHEASIAATERARAAQRTAEDRQNDRREAANERIASARQLYEAATHRYLLGVMTAAKDPAVSESAMRLSRNWPLLPAPARHEPARNG
ncbi:hypothetical protein [Streptomyces diastatochromogenes]|uniref:DUF4407 domain-containing protein n=1 Tax=Streptomyces diastatochromogenes TaxID=42236 RepID=A0A233SU27_STRDA|nr:hypothetical protein [Streptomyces diastatochromogenes]OXY99150.1 hypothetical protein BEK98_04045 [Streptomyces diastatochromogenes]